MMMVTVQDSTINSVMNLNAANKEAAEAGLIPHVVFSSS